MISIVNHLYTGKDADGKLVSGRMNVVGMDRPFNERGFLGLIVGQDDPYGTSIGGISANVKIIIKNEFTGYIFTGEFKNGKMSGTWENQKTASSGTWSGEEVEH